MPSLGDLEGYLGETTSVLFQLAAMILAGGGDPGAAEIAGHAGVAYGLAGLLRALPVHAARRQLYLPADLLARHHADPADVFVRRATPEMLAVLAELRSLARAHLAKAEAGVAALPPGLAAAFLPLALVEPHLARMDRPGADPFGRSAELSPWRKQWLLWRAARR